MLNKSKLQQTVEMIMEEGTRLGLEDIQFSVIIPDESSELLLGVSSNIMPDLYPISVKLDGSVSGAISKNFEPEEKFIELVQILSLNDVDTDKVMITETPSKLDVKVYNGEELTESDILEVFLASLFGDL